MHCVSRYDGLETLIKWFKNTEKVSEMIDLDVLTTSDLICFDCEEAECDHEVELLAEYVGEHKERVNTLIEESLREWDEVHDDAITTYCPTGVARMRWAESV